MIELVKMLKLMSKSDAKTLMTIILIDLLFFTVIITGIIIVINSVIFT